MAKMQPAGARRELISAMEAAGVPRDWARSLVDAAIEEALHDAADLVDAIDPQCTALTGPYWYGQGWHQAADHLHDLADDHPGRMRREGVDA